MHDDNDDDGDMDAGEDEDTSGSDVDGDAVGRTQDGWLQVEVDDDPDDLDYDEFAIPPCKLVLPGSWWAEKDRRVQGVEEKGKYAATVVGLDLDAKMARDSRWVVALHPKSGKKEWYRVLGNQV